MYGDSGLQICDGRQCSGKSESCPRLHCVSADCGPTPFASHTVDTCECRRGTPSWLSFPSPPPMDSQQTSAAPAARTQYVASFARGSTRAFPAHCQSALAHLCAAPLAPLAPPAQTCPCVRGFTTRPPDRHKQVLQEEASHHVCNNVQRQSKHLQIDSVLVSRRGEKSDQKSADRQAYYLHAADCKPIW